MRTITLKLMQSYVVYNEFNRIQAGKTKHNNGDIDKVRRYLRKCKLIVVRRTMNNSKPCKHCVEMIKYYGIRRIYYSYEQGLKYESGNTLTTDHVSAKYIKRMKNNKRN